MLKYKRSLIIVFKEEETVAFTSLLLRIILNYISLCMGLSVKARLTNA